jgi:hypothetical protein
MDDPSAALVGFALADIVAFASDTVNDVVAVAPV